MKCLRHKIFGSHVFRRCNRVRVAERLRGDPILAVRAVVIAAQHSETHRQASGQCMKERFLLDRIKLEGAEISMRDQQFAPAVKSNATNPVLPFPDDTAMPARKAFELSLADLAVQLPFFGVLSEKVFQS